MARFISKYERLRLWPQTRVEEDYANGRARLLQRELVVVFRQDGLLPHEVEAGMARFNFRGTMQEMNEVTTVSPSHRLSVFDSEVAARTERWTDEEHEQVLAFLRSDPNNGESFFEIEAHKAEKPWATYDEMDAEAIVGFATAGGFDPQKVHAYESENEAREEVLHWALTGEIESNEPMPATPAKKEKAAAVTVDA